MLSYFTSVKSLTQEARASPAISGRTKALKLVKFGTASSARKTRLSRCTGSRCALTLKYSNRFYTIDPKQMWDKAPPGMKEQITRMKMERAEDALMEGENVRKGFAGGIGWGAFLLFAITGGAIWWWSRQKRIEIEESRKKVYSVGDASIGGLWSLVDHEGRPMTSGEFAGKYLLIYFGFTYCPDICPMELKKMSAALDMLPDEAKSQIVPLMVSVDPWRDSIAQLAGYVKEFHPAMRGMVGTPQQTDHITRIFRVYTSKGPEETEGDYLVDHSIFMYLMDKNGKFLDYYGVALEAEEIAQSVYTHMQEQQAVARPGIIGKLKFWWATRDKN